MRKYIFLKQDNFKDCGATCLSMIIKFYGGYVNIEKLRDLTNTTKSGTTAYDIVEAAKKIGFNSYGVKCDLENINMDELYLPAIAHVIIDKSYYHFVVIYKIDKDKKTVVIADPMNNIKRLSFSKFMEIFTNNLIILYPTKKILKEKEIDEIYFLKNFLFKNKSLFIITLLIIILYIFITYINLFMLKNFFKNNKYLIPLIIMSLVKLYLGSNKDKKITALNQKINYEITNDTFNNIIDLPYQYYRNRTTGDILTRVNDVNNISDFSFIIISFFTNLLFIIVSFVLIYSIKPILFIMSFIYCFLYFIIYKIIKNKINSSLEKLKIQNSNRNSYLTEAIVGFESVKGLNLENILKEELKEKNADYLKNLNDFEKLKLKINNYKNFINDISLIFILFIGGLIVKKNYENLFLFYLIFNYLMSSINEMIEISLMMSNIKVSIKRIIDLTFYKKEIKKIYKLDKICFNNVDFNYQNKKVLKNLNLEIPLGSHMMVIGPNGYGKSTILKLIKQYYISNGISVGNTNIKKLDIKSRVAYISQNEYLFTDTLYNNIVMKRKITKKNLKKIINICCLDEFINNHDLGINMLIEENGFNLSGGERQRIILARALVGEFDYLLIDEGLSEVDKNLERIIIKNLFKNYKDKTILLVSHRFDNIDLFHDILKVDKNIKIVKNKGGVLC